MKQHKELNYIIEALGRHEDSSAVAVLERLGTNSQDEEVRRMTSKALVNRNTEDALSVVLLREGKGINDLSTNVAMSTINELLSLEDQTAAINILNRSMEMDLKEELRETASAVKALMTIS